MIEHRDRASGWKHAKLSGHINEDNVKFLLDTNEEYSAVFLKRIGLPDEPNLVFAEWENSYLSTAIMFP